MPTTEKKLRGKGIHKNVKFHYTVDCSQPVEDAIMNIIDFKNFLAEKINDKNSGDLSIENNKICIDSDAFFSKKFLKYLTKKYLKKNNLRDWLRVVASDSETYQLRYLHISNDDEEDSD